MVRLPAEYQEVEYLESVGGQWINTGITVRNGTTTEYKVVLKSLFTSLRSGSNIICCCEYGGAAGSWFGAYSRSGSSYLTVGGGNNFTEDPYSLSEKTVIFDGSKVTAIVGNQIAYRNRSDAFSDTIRFFACRATYYPSLAKIYSAKIYEDDTLIANFIPCYRKSDSKPGMYDTVTKQFFTNSGTGEFIVGNDVSYDTASLIERRRQILLNTPRIATISDGIATFKTDVPANIKDCKVYFTPVQAGSGDPSPDNVRPISG